MKIFIEYKGEQYGINRPKEEDDTLTYFDIYNMFYKLMRMANIIDDEMNEIFKWIEKIVDEGEDNADL